MILDTAKLTTKNSHYTGPHDEFQDILGDRVRYWLRKQTKQNKVVKLTR